MDDSGRTREDELARRALSDVPADDEAAKERARARLRQAMAEGSTVETSTKGVGRRTRWVAVVAAVAAVAAVLTLVALILPSGQGGPPVSAAGELQRMARLASTQPAPPVPPDERYPIHQETLMTEGGTVIGHGSFTVVARVSIEGWIRPDGSGRREVFVHEVHFASDQDRDTWIEAGSPPILHSGDRRTERYGPGELPFYDVASLPTDLDELRRELRSGRIGEFGDGTANMLSMVSSLLAQPGTSPGLRAALFELAATIDGVTLTPEASDPLGRPGVGVSLLTEAYETELLVDPSTSEILAIVDRPTAANVSTQTTTWTAFVR